MKNSLNLTLVAKLTLIGILCSFQGFTNEDPPLNTGVTGGGAQDLLNLKTLPDNLKEKKQDNVNVSITCTAESGKRVDQNDPEYQGCLKHNIKKK